MGEKGLGWLGLRGVFEWRGRRCKSGRLQQFFNLLLLITIGVEKLSDRKRVCGCAYETWAAMFGGIEHSLRVDLVLDLPLNINLLIDRFLQRQ